MVAESVRRLDSDMVSGMVSAAVWQFVCAVVAETVSRFVAQVMPVTDCGTTCEMVAATVTQTKTGMLGQ